MFQMPSHFGARTVLAGEITNLHTFFMRTRFIDHRVSSV